MLRLVHPAPAGNTTDPSDRRKGDRSPALSLTAEEVRCFRTYLRNLARAYGAWECLPTRCIRHAGAAVGRLACS